MTAPTPLWLCLKIAPQKERKAHSLFAARGIVSFYAHKIAERRVSRVSRKVVRYEVPLLTGYALVAHKGHSVFEGELLRLCWPFSDQPVVREILGRVSMCDVERLQAISGKIDKPPAPPMLTKDQIVRICEGPFGSFLAKIDVVDGKSATVTLVNSEGIPLRLFGAEREIKITTDKLEAA